jgi:hypothetical protein
VLTPVTWYPVIVTCDFWNGNQKPIHASHDSSHYDGNLSRTDSVVLSIDVLMQGLSAHTVVTLKTEATYAITCAILGQQDCDHPGPNYKMQK